MDLNNSMAQGFPPAGASPALARWWMTQFRPAHNANVVRSIEDMTIEADALEDAIERGRKAMEHNAAVRDKLRAEGKGLADLAALEAFAKANPVKVVDLSVHNRVGVRSVPEPTPATDDDTQDIEG